MILRVQPGFLSIWLMFLFGKLEKQRRFFSVCFFHTIKQGYADGT